MSVLLPWLAAAGVLGALAMAALHLLARNEPPRWLLPTARFVPESRERAPSRALHLSDKRLLALRVVALLAVALAAAGPWWHGARAVRAQLIVADLSRTVADRAAVAAAVRAAWRTGDAIVLLDRSAREVTLAQLDSAVVRPPAVRAGRLSAALLVAREAARRLARDADTVALVLVSPLTSDVMDDATLAIRARWPGAARVERVGMVSGAVLDADTTRVTLRAESSDPIRASLALDGRLGGRSDGGTTARSSIRLVRAATLTSGDSAVARAGGTVVHWPEQLAARDTVGAVRSARAVFVATLPRPVSPEGALVVAHWVDGRAAAVEAPLGQGCVRRVALSLAPAGDAALRASFRAIVRDLLAPCGGVRDVRAVDDATLRALAGTGPAAASAALVTPTADLPFVRWLLALAAIALAVEWWLRTRQERT